MNNIQKTIIEAIRKEWVKEYGTLHDMDEDQKDKYYFMIGFVSSATKNLTFNED